MSKVNWIKSIILLTVLSVLIAMIPGGHSLAAASTDADIKYEIDNVKKQVNNKYWNAKKEGKGADVLFAVTSKKCGSKCTSNKCNNSIQCDGFAMAFSEYLFGSTYNTWEKTDDLSEVRVGDVILVKAMPHTAVVIDVNKDKIKVAEVWSSSKHGCIIKFGGGFNSAYTSVTDLMSDYSGARLYKHPDNLVASSAVVRATDIAVKTAADAVEDVSAPKISSQNVNSPKAKSKVGSNFGIRGTVSANKGSLKVKGGVYNQDGSEVSGYVKQYPKSGESKSINLQKTLNNDLPFGKLKPGKYVYKITATATYKGVSSEKVIVESAFEITK